MHSVSVATRGPELPNSLLCAMAALVDRIGAGIRSDAEQDRLVLPSVPSNLIAARRALQDPNADIEVVCARSAHSCSISGTARPS